MADQTHIPFFFIIGRPRTGTTLLRSLFDAHPEVVMPWECQFILNLYPRYGKISNWTIGCLEEFYNDLLHQWQFNAWTVDHERLKSSLLALAGHTTYAEVCRTVYLNYISFFKKDTIRMIGDKNHGYTIYTERIIRIFPDARFIYILRDYRDHFHSVKNVDFEVPVVSLVVYKWKYFYRKALQAAAKRPEAFYFIRYEDLVREPETQFGRISEFLGIRYVPEVFDFYKVKPEAEKKYPADILEKHHKSLFNPINTGRIGLWERSMTDRQVRIADHVAGEYAEKAGYNRRYTTFSFRIALMGWPGIGYARFIYAMTKVIDRFPYRLREKLLSRGPLWIARSGARLLGRKK